MLAEKKRDLLFYAAAAILGLISLIVPPIILGVKPYSDPLLPSALVTGIEELSWLTVIFLSISGFGLGLLNPKRPWRWGVTTMVPFLPLAFVSQVPPFAFLLYVILMLPGIIGALIGAFCSACLKRPMKQ
jgi:hypothetical protein